ncbi:MAG: hypothetical protein PQJ46_04020 [Spirochaetales bacterium]|nr:hypothetical protein [Spirochaetales bacterium]
MQKQPYPALNYSGVWFLRAVIILDIVEIDEPLSKPGLGFKEPQIFKNIADENLYYGDSEMAEIHGKFIILACRLLNTNPKAKEAAFKNVFNLTGKNFYELEPESWYDSKILEAIFQGVRDNCSPIIAKAIIRLIGENVYPKIEATTGLPDNLETPLDFIKFEAKQFLEEHRGSDVVPRKIAEAKEGKVVVFAISPGYDCILIEGVYLGILNMCGVSKKEVIQTRCIKKGDPFCEYLIRWNI